MSLNRCNCTGVEGEVVDNMLMKYEQKCVICQEKGAPEGGFLLFFLLTAAVTCCVYVKPVHVKHVTLEWHFHNFLRDNRGLLACEIACCDIQVRKNSPVKPLWRIGFNAWKVSKGT